MRHKHKRLQKRTHQKAHKIQWFCFRSEVFSWRMSSPSGATKMVLLLLLLFSGVFSALLVFLWNFVLLSLAFLPLDLMLRYTQQHYTIQWYYTRSCCCFVWFAVAVEYCSKPVAPAKTVVAVAVLSGRSTHFIASRFIDNNDIFITSDRVYVCVCLYVFQL